MERQTDRHEQPTQEIIIDPKQICLAYLEREREQWLPHYQKVRRSDGMNGEAVCLAAIAMSRIDPLLDELHGLT